MARTKKSRQRGSVGMQLARKAAHSLGAPFPRAAPEYSCRRCAGLGPEYRYAEDVGGLCSEHEAEEREEDERERRDQQRAAEAEVAQAAERVVQDAERVVLRAEVAAALNASRPAGQRGGGAETQTQSVKRERARVSYALSAASPKDLVAHLQAVVNGAGKSAEAALALAALLPASRFPPMPKRLKLCVRCEGEFDQAYPITDECRVEHTWGGTAGSGNNSLSFVKYCTSCERNISCGHYGVITHKEDRWCYIGAHKASGRAPQSVPSIHTTLGVMAEKRAAAGDDSDAPSSSSDEDIP